MTSGKSLPWGSTSDECCRWMRLEEIYTYQQYTLGQKSTREKSAFSGFSMSRLQMFRISRQELYKPCNVYKDQNERDMGSIMWLSGYWRPSLYVVWLGGPGVPQSPFSQAQEGPPGTRGPCLFTQLGPQAVCGTRPNRLYSYCLRPTQTHTHTPSCKTWLCLF